MYIFKTLKDDKGYPLFLFLPLPIIARRRDTNAHVCRGTGVPSVSTFVFSATE